jgi:hypothetical protein
MAATMAALNAEKNTFPEVTAQISGHRSSLLQDGPPVSSNKTIGYLR